jgi:hypothetical protein
VSNMSCAIAVYVKRAENLVSFHFSELVPCVYI